MPLTHLDKWVTFDIEDFTKGLDLRYAHAQAVKQMKYGDDSKPTDEVEFEGVKVTLTILADANEYNIGKRDDAANPPTNIGQSIDVKVRGASLADFAKYKPMQTKVRIRDVEKAKAYAGGNSRSADTLSIIARVEAVDGDGAVATSAKGQAKDAPKDEQ